jgi:hypothetical protein
MVRRSSAPSRPISPSAVRPAWRPSYVYRGQETDRAKTPPVEMRMSPTRHSANYAAAPIPSQSSRPSSSSEPTRKEAVPTKPTVKKNGKKKSSKKSKKQLEAYEKLSSNVVLATKKLEEVSERLLHVAESLSESAMMNVSQELSRLRSKNVTPEKKPKTPERGFENGHRVSNSHMNGSNHPLNMSDMSMSLATEDPRLAELVKERMQSQLHRILSQQLNEN